MIVTFKALLKDDAGQGLVEYALILALIALIALVALRLLGGKVYNSLNNSATKLPGAVVSPGRGNDD